MSVFSKKIKPVLDPIEDKEDADISPYDKILSYLSHGKLDKALDLLIEQGIEEALLLKTRLVDVHTLSEMGKLKNAELNITRNRITHAILCILEPTTPQDDFISPFAEPEIEPTVVYKPRQKALSEAEKAHVAQLILQNKTKEALHFCKDFGYAFTALSNTYVQTLRNDNLRLMTEDDKKQAIADINDAIRDLII